MNSTVTARHPLDAQRAKIIARIVAEVETSLTLVLRTGYYGCVQLSLAVEDGHGRSIETTIKRHERLSDK